MCLKSYVAYRVVGGGGCGRCVVEVVMGSGYGEWLCELLWCTVAGGL